jgi:hypothetical protein
MEFVLSPEDRYHLMQLSTEVRIRSEEFALARVRLDAAKALSDAAGDVVLAKMGVPKAAQDVTIDINQGILRFQAPVSS